LHPQQGKKYKNRIWGLAMPDFLQYSESIGGTLPDPDFLNLFRHRPAADLDSCCLTESHMPDLSPYTRAMAQCLSTLEDTPPEEVDCTCPAGHLLVNMLQGRMLEHLKYRVGLYYGLDPDTLGEEFSTALIEVFNMEIFGAFRRKIESQPWLIFFLAQRIVKVESTETADPQQRVNRLYLSIFRKHLEYRNLESIITALQTDPRIQNTIVRCTQRHYGTYRSGFSAAAS